MTVTAGGRKQVAQRQGGGSYQSANDPRLHFGLGKSDRVESIEIRWPSGQSRPFQRRARRYGLPGAEGEAKLLPLAGFSAPYSEPKSK